MSRIPFSRSAFSGFLWAAVVSALALFPGTAQAQWQPSGPDGGKVNGFTAKDSFLFAALEDGGIYRSSDTGRSWTSVKNGITEPSVYALAVKGKYLFAGTNKREFGLQEGGYVFRSEDNGDNWIRLGGGLPEALFTSFTVLDSRIYAGSPNKGTWWSDDNGDSWHLIMRGEYPFHVYGLATIGDALFAASATSAAGIFRSTDSGGTWTKCDLGSFGDYPHIAVHEGVIYASVSTTLHRSLDTGKTWTQVNYAPELSAIEFISVNEGGLFVKAYLPLMHSLDSGGTWSEIKTSFDPGYLRGVYSYGGCLFAAVVGGVYRSSDGGSTWAPSSLGMGAHAIESLAAVDSLAFADTFVGGFRSSDHGTSWSPIDTSVKSGGIISLARRGSTLFATMPGGLFRSADNGVKWTSVTKELENKRPLSVLVEGDTLFCGTRGMGVWVSKDNGATWTSRKEGLGDPFVVSLAKLGSNLYAATNSRGVYRSTDLGLTWTSFRQGYEFDITRMAALGNSLYIIGTGGVYRRATDQQEWVPVNQGLKIEERVSNIVGTGGDLFLANGGRVYHSSDEGASWNAISEGMEWEYVHTLAVGGSRLYAGTGGGSVWSRPLLEVSSLRDTRKAAWVFPGLSGRILRSGSPLLLEIALATPMRITLHNVQGKLASILMDSQLPAGRYSVPFPTDLAGQGMHFLRFDTGKQVVTRRVLLEP